MLLPPFSPLHLDFVVVWLFLSTWAEESAVAAETVGSWDWNRTCEAAVQKKECRKPSEERSFPCQEAPDGKQPSQSASFDRQVKGTDGHQQGEPAACWRHDRERPFRSARFYKFASVDLSQVENGSSTSTSKPEAEVLTTFTPRPAPALAGAYDLTDIKTLLKEWVTTITGRQESRLWTKTKSPKIK